MCLTTGLEQTHLDGFLPGVEIALVTETADAGSGGAMLSCGGCSRQGWRQIENADIQRKT